MAETIHKKTVVGVTHYDADVSNEYYGQELNIRFFVRKNMREFPGFLDEFLEDLQQFIDEKYNK